MGGKRLYHPAISQDVIDRLGKWVHTQEVALYDHTRTLNLHLKGGKLLYSITVNQALDRLLKEAGF